MKKRIILLVVVVALLVMSLTACGSTANSVDDAAMEMANFEPIEGKEYLAYNIDTRVVYYMFSTYEAEGYAGYGYSYFAPYISENGRFCRYIKGEIVEIVDTNNWDLGAGKLIQSSS